MDQLYLWYPMQWVSSFCPEFQISMCFPHSMQQTRAPGLTPRTIETDRRLCWSILSLLCLIFRCTPIRKYSVQSHCPRTEVRLQFHLCPVWCPSLAQNKTALSPFSISEPNFPIQVSQNIVSVPVTVALHVLCSSVHLSLWHSLSFQKWGKARFDQLQKITRRNRVTGPLTDPGWQWDSLLRKDLEKGLRAV